MEGKEIVAKEKMAEKKVKAVSKMAVVRSRVKVEGEVDVKVPPSLDDFLPFIYRYHRVKVTIFCDLKSNFRPHSSNLNRNICEQGAMPCRKKRHLLACHTQLRTHSGRICAPRAALLLAGEEDSDLNTQRSKSRISSHHNGAHASDKPLGASGRI